MLRSVAIPSEGTRLSKRNGARNLGVASALFVARVSADWHGFARRSVVRYKDLDVWQRGRELVAVVYQLTATYPPHEMHGLVSQIRRSAVSIPANIAEGYGRRSAGAYVQFLRTAKGSANELETLLILSVDLGYVESDDVPFTDIAKLGSMLSNLIAKIQSEGVREDVAAYGTPSDSDEPSQIQRIRANPS